MRESIKKLVGNALYDKVELSNGVIYYIGTLTIHVRNRPNRSDAIFAIFHGEIYLEKDFDKLEKLKAFW